jgi:anthranilate phosphoribosyltransferase
MLKPLIEKALAGQDLTQTEMAQAVGSVMDGEGSPIQVAAFLVALRAKGEKTAEITGAAQAMRARMNQLSIKRLPLIDTCGTGGSGTGSFNISTAVAFVAASAGAAVAKHGNKAISSKSGSADVLSELGVNISAPLETMKSAIEDVGVGFLFAPNYHPAMRHAGTVRRELGLRTIFNVLGPLTNPAGAPRQLMGIFDRSLTTPIAQVLGNLGSEKAWVVHGSDGVDELTICGESYVSEWNGTEVIEHIIHPEKVGLKIHPEGAMKGGTPSENAKQMRLILSGKDKGPLNDAIALNAGAALLVAGIAADLSSGVKQAKESMEAGKPLQILESLVKITN